MKWTSRQGVALIWIVAVFAGAFFLAFDSPWMWNNFWLKLVAPFVTASLLGIWLVAGRGPVWLRLMGMLVGQSVLILVMSLAVPENPAAFTPGLAATTASTAMAMLGLGCLGAVLPIQSTWSIRIALWEVVISVGLIGVTLAVIRGVSEMYQWDWPNWATNAAIHYLVFSLYTGLLMMIVLLPLIVRGRNPRLFAIVLLLLGILLIPPMDYLTFMQFDLRVSGLDLFYAAHTGQVVMALAIMIPMVLAFPGVLVRQTQLEVQPVEQPVDIQQQESVQQDFADMQ
ncbi:hypothetical protein [Bremerella sp.]|uniref:hypothetical protein n=1 Tax=Bremerella sp. TaxID=2795602 RepID=UPI0039193E94